MIDLDVTEADLFSNAIGSALWSRVTLFPLHGITPKGECACGRDTCRAIGKHPAVLWGPESLPDGTKLTQREDGVGVGVGLATGLRSGGIVVIDVDVKDGADGRQTLQDLESKYGPLPETLRVDSPSGGFHLYFYHPARLETNVGKVGAGIDIKGEGGYVVIPGSPHKRGGVYRLEIDSPVRLLPGPWADMLPRAGAARRSIVRDTVPSVDAPTLRQRMADTAKGRKGDTWATIRAIALGERALRLAGAPEGAAPLVIGVDEYLNKQVIWPLACEGDWCHVAGADVAEIAAPSLSLLRLEAQELGTPSKWTPEVFAERWDRAANKIAAERAESADVSARMLAAAAMMRAREQSASPLPVPAVQINRAYYLLDDRDEKALRYVGPLDQSVVAPMARKLWGDRRVLETETKKEGLRDMNAAEIVYTHGTPAERLAIEYAASRPYVSDLTLVQTLRLDVPRPEPRYDPEVERWLRLLDPTEAIETWLAHASPERCADTAPALALVGEASIGKTVLAAAVARAAGQETYSPLARCMGKFAGDLLGDGPIIFGDEGIPRDERTQVPKTEEFRDLVTRAIHKLEKKGQSASVLVRGGVRVILAANSMGRLFSNRGTFSGADIAAIARRLLVVELLDTENARACAAAVDSLGTSTLDPARLDRIAGHVRYLQSLDLPAPRPRSGSVEKALRAGGDLAVTILSTLEDRAADSDWCCPDESTGLLWVRTDTLARAVSTPPGPTMRAIAAYVRVSPRKVRNHPVTCQALDARASWAGLDLVQLRADGCEISGRA